MANLLIFPLVIMLVLSIFGVAYYGVGVEANYYVDYDGNVVVGHNGETFALGTGYYDEGGRLIAYTNWTIAVADAGGRIEFGKGSSPRYYFINSTGSYELCDNASGLDTHDVLGLAGSGMAFSSLGGLLTNSMGFLLLVAGVMAGVTVAGIHVLGIGISETSIKGVVFGCFFIGLWLIVSIVPYKMFSDIPLYGYLGYAILSFIYTLGMLEVFGA